MDTLVFFLLSLAVGGSAGAYLSENYPAMPGWQFVLMIMGFEGVYIGMVKFWLVFWIISLLPY